MKYVGIFLLVAVILLAGVLTAGSYGLNLLDKKIKSLSSVGKSVDIDLGKFKVKDLQGNYANMQDLTIDRPSVIVLWASWHEASVAQLKILAGAKETYPDLNVIAINLGEEENLFRSIAISTDYPFTYLHTETFSGLKQLGISALPVSFVVDKQNKIRHFGRTLQLEDIATFALPQAS